MQCCGELELTSSGGVLECHPYVLGGYRKIGVCGGRSFYQHKNNSDIFMYHACGAWYLGLEVYFMTHSNAYTYQVWIYVSFFFRLERAVVG